MIHFDAGGKNISISFLSRVILMILHKLVPNLSQSTELQKNGKKL
jgi:hypothetical protein